MGLNASVWWIRQWVVMRSCSWRTDSWLVSQTQTQVTCPLTTLSCTCGTANMEQNYIKGRISLISFYLFFDATQWAIFWGMAYRRAPRKTIQLGDAFLDVTSPVRLSTPLQICRPGELRSAPSTDPCSSEPAWAPCLWPSAVCEEMPPRLLPQLPHHTKEPISDCLTPRCAPAEMRWCVTSCLRAPTRATHRVCVHTWMSRSFRDSKARSLSVLSCCLWTLSSRSCKIKQTRRYVFMRT